MVYNPFYLVETCLSSIIAESIALSLRSKYFRLNLPHLNHRALAEELLCMACGFEAFRFNQQFPVCCGFIATQVRLEFQVNPQPRRGKLVLIIRRILVDARLEGGGRRVLDVIGGALGSQGTEVVTTDKLEPRGAITGRGCVL